MRYNVERPANEPILEYKPGSAERASIKVKLDKLLKKEVEIPLIIGGKEYRTGNTVDCRCPHDHQRVIGKYHLADKKHVQMAINAALAARKEWAAQSWETRVAVFWKMADLLAGPYKDLINAATMLDQSKNIFQAEIDATCELIDFWRFNIYYYTKILEDQPLNGPGVWNRLQYRGLEGFVLAVTPFNFTAIGGNLPTLPAIPGGVSLWKPASNSVYAGHFLMKLFKEAGLPDGVVNYIPGPGREVGPVVMNDPNLSGIHFTGSTEVFQSMWHQIGTNIHQYHNYPRIVGETGGKNFIFAHSTANRKAVTAAIIRGSFEYQGQKCSAASRAYISKSVWSDIKDDLLHEISTIKMGDVLDFGNFMNAVIDKEAFKTIKEYIEYAKASSDAEVICGGGCDDSKGYFIEPTIIVAKDPKFKTMVEEIFGPVMTVYVYDDNKFEEILELCDQTSAYALTGTIIAQDRYAIETAQKALVHAAGNFYINDKCTGAVVGQQPFGGSRASGTNDKAGTRPNLMRWISTRTIKETFVPPIDYRYPFLDEK